MSKGNKNVRQNCIISRRKTLLTGVQSLDLVCYLLLLIAFHAESRFWMPYPGYHSYHHLVVLHCYCLYNFKSSQDLLRNSLMCRGSEVSIKLQHSLKCWGGGAYLGCLINHIHFSEEIHRKKCVNGAVGHMQMGLFPLHPEVISLQSYIDNRRFPL